MKRGISKWQTSIFYTWMFLHLFLKSTTMAQPICPEMQVACESESNPGSHDHTYEDEHYGGGYNDYAETSDYVTTNHSASCIPQEARCDGKEDCHDCSDERNCPSTTVFFCVSKSGASCIPITKTCDNVTDCLSGEDECDCPGAFHCDDDGFSSKCIPNHQVCDGNFDCLDHQDEIELCDVFTCPTNERKLPKFQICDGKNDCGDVQASDECNCSNTFVCPTGECLHNSKRCDGVFDCLDGNDECNCPADNQGNKNFVCEYSGKCLNASTVCDGKVDCGSYVTQGNTTKGNKSNHYVIDCSDEQQGSCSTHFQCHDAHWFLQTGAIVADIQTCVHASKKCDGTAHCSDASDECGCDDSVSCPSDDKKKTCMLRRNFCDSQEHCSGGSDEVTKGFGFKCSPPLSEHSKNPCILPQFMIDDGVVDCKGEIDQCYRNGTWRCFQCFDGSMVISDQQLCDGVVDCPDLSDECVCTENRPQICEVICGMNELTDCPLGKLKCKRQNTTITEYEYVPFNKICDGSNDCLSLFASRGEFLDEMFCYHENRNEKDMQCPSGSSGNPLRPLMAAKCDKRSECAGFLDECDPKNPCEDAAKFCENVSASVDIRLRGELRFFCPTGVRADSRSDNLFGLPGPLVCNGVIDCNGDGEDEVHCPKRFYCDAGERAGKKVISIDQSQKCDGNFDCLNESDELNCSMHFYCENGIPLFVPKAVRFDGKADCSDKSDECPTEQLEGAFASNLNMIASPVLLAMVWIMAFISTFGNFIVICHQIMIFFRSKKIGTQNVALSNRVMLLNLACADFLTGIYLFLLAVKTVQFSGDYCYQDKIWRTSSTCANLGLLNSIATETAVVILILMTTYRLLAVYKPFYTASVNPYKIELICLCGWVIVIFVMMFPRASMFSDYFSNTAWYPLPFFKEDVVTKDEIIELISQYGVLTDNFSNTNDTSWAYVEEFVRQKNFNESRFAKFGYYSKHSVCIPNMLAADNDPAVGYSAIITSFNLIAFAYVVIAYTFIYRGAMEKTKGRNRQYSTNNSTYVMRTQSSKPLTGDKSLLRQSMMKVKTSTPKSTVMQRRIYRLVFSNLACWLPLTIMATVKLCGGNLSNDAYAVAAIILLPITSALNPILYSNYISVAWDRLKNCFCKKQRNDSQTQDPMPVTDRSQLSASIKSAKV